MFKQKTAYEMRISDLSSDVCYSDLQRITTARIILGAANRDEAALIYARPKQLYDRITYDSVQVPSPPTLVPSDFPDGDPEPVLKLSDSAAPTFGAGQGRSEEHTSELQSLMRNPYAVFCLKKKTTYNLA